MQVKAVRGFTLIELMVTIVVAAVLVGLAVPSFREMMIKSHLRGATDDVVNLLNQARGSAVKLQRDVNFSVKASAWCAGAVSASSPSTVGNPVPGATACDCTASPVACTIGTDEAIVASSTHAGVTISTTSGNAINNSAGGITFNSKYGSLALGSLPANPIITLTAGNNNEYSTQVSISQLGEAHVCRPSTSKFISGYPSC
jgi:type IV fimbrial biogenesis protein FimT